MSDEKSTTKKKWFIGCGITLVLVLIIVSIGAYFVINKAKSIMGSGQMDPSSYVSLIENDDYAPPTDKVILEDDLKAYLKISKEIQLGIEKKYENEGLKFNWENNQNYLNVVAKLYDIREIQADILKANSYSVKKYKWMTRQLVIIFGGDLVRQMNMLIRIRSSDQAEIDSAKEIRNIPQENLDLFNTNETEIAEVIGLWVLGI
jgi:hypothetical protein